MMIDRLYKMEMLRSAAERACRAPALLSLFVVIAGSCLAGIFAESIGCRFDIVFTPVLDVHNPIIIHNPVVSVWHSFLFLFCIWIVLTFAYALYRAKETGGRADVKLAAALLAVPYYLISILVPYAIGSGLGRDADPGARLSGWAAISCASAAALVLMALMKRHANVRQPEPTPSAAAITSRSWKASRAGSKALGITALLIVFGGIYFGYLARYPFLTLYPLDRGVETAAIAVVFWLLMSWMLGGYRIRRLHDPQGMKASLIAVGRPISAFFLVSAALVKIIGMMPLSNAHDLMDSVQVDAIMLSTMASAVYLFFVLQGLAASPAGVSAAGPASPAPSGAFDSFLNRVGRAEPHFRKWADAFAGMILFQPDGFSETSTPADGTGRRWGPAVICLAIAVLAQVCTVSIVGTPVLGNFIGLRSQWPDILFGGTLALVSLGIIGTAIAAAQRLLGAKPDPAAVASALGYALLPLSLSAIVAGFLSQEGGSSVALYAYPVLLTWGLGYLMSKSRSILIPNRSWVSAGTAVLLAALIGYTGSWFATNAIHRSLLRFVDVPVAQVRDRLPDEIGGVYADDVRKAFEHLTGVDLADVQASDLLDHVIYSRKVADRFYGRGGSPDKLPSIRIRAEVTSNAGWMRYLYPRMQKLTAHAGTPQEATRIIYDWVRSQVTDVTPATFPLGDKFGLDPLTTLRGRKGDQVDVAVLMVAALRSAGVAANTVPVFPDRFANGAYTLAMYYDGSEWKPCYPSMGKISEPKTDPKSLSALINWLRHDGMGADSALYIFQGGIWRPYSTGERGAPAMVSSGLLPGKYLGVYRDGNVCHTRSFTVQRSWR